MGFYQGYAPGMPGLGNVNYSRGRTIWAGLAGIQYLPTGGIIASALCRDPDNFAGPGNYGNETEPETPPTTTGLSQLPQLAGVIDGQAPTMTLLGYAGILRAGLLMGRITSTPSVILCGSTATAYKGLFRASILGLTTAPFTSTGTSVTITAQCAYELTRQIGLGVTSFKLIGADSVTATTNCTAPLLLTTAPTFSGSTWTTTFSAATITGGAGTMASGAFLTPADGSQNPVTFVDEQFGLNMIDTLGSTVDAGNASGNIWPIAPFPRVPIAGGMVNVLNLVNYPITPATGSATQTAQQTFIKANLNSGGGVGVVATQVNYGGKFNFTDDYGL